MSETCRGHLWEKVILKLFASSWYIFLTYGNAYSLHRKSVQHSFAQDDVPITLNLCTGCDTTESQWYHIVVCHRSINDQAVNTDQIWWLSSVKKATQNKGISHVHATQALGWVVTWLHSVLNSTVDGDSHIHAPSALPLVKEGSEHSK
jgi:hypothetical protein